MKENINDAFNLFFDNKLTNVHTIIPGQIEEYQGHTERKARVKPLVKLKTINNKSISINPIDNVPVIFPSANSFNLLFPLNKGDGCLLLFSESPIGNFLGSANEQESDSLVRFSLTDCIALVGLHSFRNVPNAQTKIEIGDDFSITLETTTGKIKIETSGNITFDDGTEPYMLGTTWKSAYDTYMNVVASITPGNEAANAAALSAIKAAAIVLLTQHTSILSNFIKGK
jgi:hypothetical protein